jgi:hypothetical protein
MVLNVHERLLPVPAGDVGRLLDRLGGTDDPLWPAPAWGGMRLDRPLGVGAAGEHGPGRSPIRYHVTAHRPGRSVEFTFAPGLGLDGTHTFLVEPVDAARCVLRHDVQGRLSGRMRLGWPLAVRWMHDAVLEDLLDRAEVALGVGPARPARWSPWVRLLWRLGSPRAKETSVPATPLLAGVLERVDWSDAYIVECGPGMPTDPQVWAEAVFRDPPGWVRVLLGLRQALVGLIGIERGDSAAFDTLARRDDEVLLGTDAGHLDFRVSILHAADAVTLTTVVQCHNRRGRLYSMLVRRVHPAVVRAMLSRAARSAARSYDLGSVETGSGDATPTRWRSS